MLRKNVKGNAQLLLPEPPGLATESIVVGIFQLEPISSYTAGVVVECKMFAVSGNKTLRNKVLADPALDATAGCIDGCVFKTASTITSPVVSRLRQWGRKLRTRWLLKLGDVQGRELIVCHRLRGGVGADLVRVSAWLGGGATGGRA